MCLRVYVLIVIIGTSSYCQIALLFVRGQDRNSAFVDQLFGLAGFEQVAKEGMVSWDGYQHIYILICNKGLNRFNEVEGANKIEFGSVALEHFE